MQQSRAVAILQRWGLLFIVILLGLPILWGPGIAHGSDDSSHYMLLGLHYLKGLGPVSPWGDPDLLRPLFPVLLASAFAILGVSVQSAAWVGKCFGLLSIVALYWLGKRLYGRWPALVGAGLMASSAYLLDLHRFVRVDSVLPFFSLLFLLWLDMAFATGRRRYFALSGAFLILGFYVKPTAGVWALLPVILLLLLPSQQRLGRLAGLVIFYVAVAASYLPWWSYGAVITQDFFPTGLPTALKPWFDAGGKWLLLGLLATSMLMLAATRYGMRRTHLGASLTARGRRFYQVHLRFFTTLFVLTGIVIVLLCVPLYTLVQDGQIAAGQISLSELLSSYRQSVPWFFKERIIPIVPFFYPMLAAWLWTLGQALFKRRRADLMLLLSLSLFSPVVLYVCRYAHITGPRTLVPLLALSYLLLGRFLVDCVTFITSGIQTIIKKESRQFGICLLVVIVSVYSLWQSVHTVIEIRRQGDIGWLNQDGVRIAEWIAQNVPTGARVMSSMPYVYQIHFLTQAEYKLYLAGRRITQLGGLLAPLTSADAREKDSLIYVGYGSRPPPLQEDVFYALYEHELIRQLLENRIDYLVMARDYLESHPATWDHFTRNSMFEEVYRGKDVATQVEISIFKIHADQLTYSRSPLVITPKALLMLLNHGYVSPSPMSDEDLIEVLATNGLYIELHDEQAVEAYARLATFYLDMGQLSRFELLIEDYTPDFAAVAHLGMGDACLAQGRVEEARDAYQRALAFGQQAVAASPYEVWLRIYLAEAYAIQGEVGEVLAQYQQISELEPKNVKACNRLGKLYRERVKSHGIELDEAIALLREISIHNPEVTWPHLELGHLYREKGKLDEAVAEYQEAIELGLTTAYIQLGDLYKAQGRAEEAIALYRAAARRYPGAAWPHVELGHLYREKGKLDEAVAEYQEVIELGLTTAGMYIQLGDLYKAQGRAEEAIALYRAAARRYPDAAWPHIELEKLYLEEAGRDETD